MSEEILLAGVSKSYGTGAGIVPVLNDASLRGERGEFLALTGPSGSGKSTVLNLIAGLDTADKGEVSVFGTRLGTLSDAQRAAWRVRNVGLIFQSGNLLPALRVIGNIEVALMLMDIGAAERAKRVAAALETAGLSGCARHWPSMLSGAQRQRVAIARAIAADASLMICDEPTGELGREASEEVMELLRALHRNHGKTIVLATHDPFIAAYASRTLPMGKELEGGPQVIKHRRPAEALVVGQR
jgi:putative ABC transport system ATP-binding protein